MSFVPYLGLVYSESDNYKCPRVLNPASIVYLKHSSRCQHPPNMATEAYLLAHLYILEISGSNPGWMIRYYDTRVIVFVNPSSNIHGYHVKVGRDRFLSHDFQFIIHSRCSVLHCTNFTVENASFNRLRINKLNKVQC